MPSQLSNTELVNQYLAGDEKAFETLVERHKNGLYSMLLLITKDPYIAEDIFQETFIKIIKLLRKGNYKESGKFSYWLQRIGYNMAIDYFRKHQRSPVLDPESSRELINNIELRTPSIEETFSRRETNKELHRHIRELPTTQRQVLIMRHYLNMSFQDIADRMDSSVNTALGRMRYALINLRKSMTKNKSQYERKNRLSAGSIPLWRAEQRSSSATGKEST